MISANCEKSKIDWYGLLIPCIIPYCCLHRSPNNLAVTRTGSKKIGDAFLTFLWAGPPLYNDALDHFMSTRSSVNMPFVVHRF